MHVERQQQQRRPLQLQRLRQQRTRRDAGAPLRAARGRDERRLDEVTRDDAETKGAELRDRADVDVALAAFVARHLSLDQVLGAKAPTATPFRLKLDAGEHELASLREVAEAMCSIRSSGDELAIPGMPWCSANQ